MDSLIVKITSELHWNIPSGWLDEAIKTVQTTYEILDEIQNSGHRYKKLTKIDLACVNDPVWQGTSAIEGFIQIDPSQHDARAIAHELGHSFDERWRAGKQVSNAEIRGQSMAEAIRHFVEGRMGNVQWSCQTGWEGVLQKCNYDFNVFNRN